MPKIETVEISLPNYPDSKIVIYKKAPFGLVGHFKAGMEPIEVARMALPRMIVEWNMLDMDGNVMAITQDNIETLPADDVMALLTHVTDSIGPTLKKKTSDELAVSSEESKSPPLPSA